MATQTSSAPAASPRLARLAARNGCLSSTRRFTALFLALPAWQWLATREPNALWSASLAALGAT
jgi:hypothetical protein